MFGVQIHRAIAVNAADCAAMIASRWLLMRRVAVVGRASDNPGFWQRDLFGSVPTPMHGLRARSAEREAGGDGRTRHLDRLRGVVKQERGVRHQQVAI